MSLLVTPALTIVHRTEQLSTDPSMTSLRCHRVPYRGVDDICTCVLGPSCHLKIAVQTGPLRVAGSLDEVALAMRVVVRIAS